MRSVRLRLAPGGRAVTADARSRSCHHRKWTSSPAASTTLQEPGSDQALSQEMDQPQGAGHTGSEKRYGATAWTTLSLKVASPPQRKPWCLATRCHVMDDASRQPEHENSETCARGRISPAGGVRRDRHGHRSRSSRGCSRQFEVQRVRCTHNRLARRDIRRLHRGGRSCRHSERSSSNGPKAHYVPALGPPYAGTEDRGPGHHLHHRVIDVASWRYRADRRNTSIRGGSARCGGSAEPGVPLRRS